MRTSENIDQVITALSQAQGQFPSAKKASTSHFGKYSDISAIIDCIREPFQKNNLALIQAPSNPEGQDGVTVTTRVAHKSGQWLEDEFTMRISDRATPHQYGGLITYMRRYSAAAMLGLAQEDDDADSMTMQVQSAAKPKSRLTKQQEKVLDQAKSCATKADGRKLWKDLDVETRVAVGTRFKQIVADKPEEVKEDDTQDSTQAADVVKTKKGKTHES
jgi:hypothetical protein